MPEALPPSACVLGAHLPALSCCHGPGSIWTPLLCLSCSEDTEPLGSWECGSPSWESVVSGKAVGARCLQGWPGTPKHTWAMGCPRRCEPLCGAPAWGPEGEC